MIIPSGCMKSKHYFFLILFVLLIPNGLFAAEFQALVGIPGLTDMTGPGSLNQYINALYRLSISIAALLAVIKIVAAGAKYMLSDIITHKEDAKKDIQGALIGLLIVIGAIVILNTINSDLTNLNLAVPVQQITQGEALEKALYDAVTADCDRPGRSSQCETLTCEGWVFNKVETRPGEDIIQACRRVCLTDLHGAYDPKLYSPSSATCRYDPLIAKKCDANNSDACCEKIQKGTWYPGHNQCLTTTNQFDKVTCGFGTLSNNPTICSDVRAACIASKNTVISQSEIPGDAVTEISILCTDNTQAVVNEQNDSAETACADKGWRWVTALNICEDPNEVISTGL